MTTATLAYPAGSRNGLSVIERAFELARSGTCNNVQEVGMRLKSERFESVEAHLAGASIRRQLRDLCAGKADSGATAA
jgi:hypothetical protein